jgi:hypothetical protein
MCYKEVAMPTTTRPVPEPPPDPEQDAYDAALIREYELFPPRS